MRKTTYLLLLVIIASSIVIATSGRSQNISSNSHEIIITSNEDGYLVEETITLASSETDEHFQNIVFWIKNGNNVNIVIDGNETTPTSEGYEYTINVTSMNIKTNQNPVISITYIINKDAEFFNKEIKRPTSSLTVTYDNVIIYSSEDLTVGNSFDLSLIKQTETITETQEVEAPATIYYAIIVILVILLIALLSTKSKKKQSPSKVKESANVSEELLNTKKFLLMGVLKEIEKQHRAKDISDDTYHKLRDQYKQEAVIAMKQLEDMKSKVK